MTEENKILMEFTHDEILNVTDWFNGYIARYYGTNPEIVTKNLPENHKKLIDRFLQVSDEMSEPLSEELVEKIKHPMEVPDFVAEWFEIHKDELEYHIWHLIIKSNEDYADYESDKTDMRYWIQYAPYHPIETLFRMKDGYTVKPKQLMVKKSENIYVHDISNGLYSTITIEFCDSKSTAYKFTDKAKAKAVALLVDGSVVEI